MSENIGSYSYSKPIQEMARNAAALEVTGEALGIPMFDLAVQLLARRTIAGGVYSAAISVFDRVQRQGRPGSAEAAQGPGDRRPGPFGTCGSQ